MAEQISQETQQKIRQFQEAQQQARILMGQKYQIELQLKEAKNAAEELGKPGANDVYKAVGQILIKSEKDKLLSELKEKIEAYDVRLKTIEKQEKKLVEKMQELQTSLKKEFSSAEGMPAGEGG
jgi:prefoldin beta subunit